MSSRLHPLNDRPVADGDYVLYWMTAARRTRWNAALDHAAEQARRLCKPLLIFEPLRAGYRWASVRHSLFAMQGMVDNAARCAAVGVGYHPYVEPEPDAGKGLLDALAARACLVVADLFPAFFLPAMVQAAGARLPVAAVAVDGNGVLPLAEHGKVFARAVDFRRHLQKTLRPHLEAWPSASPLGRDLSGAVVPEAIARRWPAAPLADPLPYLRRSGVDAEVGPAPLVGGSVAGEARLARFLDRLDAYPERNHPDRDAASGLSPWLHWGHVSAQEVAWAVLNRRGWNPGKLAEKATGSRAGWWGLDEAAEGFLDELITWRELAFGAGYGDPNAEAFDGLPAWARKTLAEHADDPRELVSMDALEAGRSGDPIWDAAQRQLVQTGVMHNYLRMLWGKKVLQWSATPKEAFDRLVHLNNRWAVDGRDPNSYAGISWVFGRYDRAWGPERPIFGKVRYMTSDSTRRKLKLTGYLRQYGPPARQRSLL